MDIQKTINNINLQLESAKETLENWESGCMESGVGVATDDVNVWEIKDTTEKSIIWARQNCEALELAIVALKEKKEREKQSEVGV